MKFLKIILVVGILLNLAAPAMAASSVDIDNLIPRPGESINPTDSNQSTSAEESLTRGLQEQYPELEAFGNLPEVSVEGAVTVAIKTVLAWTMLLALIAIVVAGIFYIRAEGDEEKVAKAKRIFTYLVVGMAIIAAAYGVVSGIAQFQFF